MACVDLPALPLQLLIRRRPDWAPHPAVVVDRDKPSGIIEWANEAARAHRILPGMRYAADLALSRHLRGGVVTRTEIDAGVKLLAERLSAFSPSVEPSPQEPGVFWLDASGLRNVYPSLDTWASCIGNDLRKARFDAVAAVGFSRFGSYAAARAGKNIVFDTPAHERAFLRSVQLARLGLQPNLRHTLSKLGIHTMGAFLDLPVAGVRSRFGSAAEDLHRFARGQSWVRLMPIRFIEPLVRTASFEYPEEGRDRLFAAISTLLDPLLAELAERHEALASIQLALTLDDGSEQREDLSPATATLDARQILSLIRLRLESLTLSSGVVELHVHVLGVENSPQQLGLFADASPQHLEAAERGIEQVRAQLGDGAVVCARLADGHVPEASFTWEPLRRFTPPKPTDIAVPPLIRRLYSPPVPLPFRNPHEPDGWLVAGAADGPVEEISGPHTLSDAWWGNEVLRVYYYVRTRSGRVLWIYRDQKSRRWFLHGEVQ